MGDLEIINLLLKLENTSSTNSKVEIIKQHDCHELREFFNYMYSYRIKFGIDEKTFSSEHYVKESMMYEFDSMNDIFEWLSKNNTGTNDAKDFVRAFCFEFFDEGEAVVEMVERCFLRNLRIGIDAKLINKALHDCIEVFDVPLAMQIEKVVNFPKPDSHYIAEAKIDGVRVLAILDDNKVSMLTRNGKEVTGFDDILSELEYLRSKGYRVVFDGELLNDNFKGTTEVLFKKSIGKKATYVVWDLIKLNEFNHPSMAKTRLYERKEHLRNLLEMNLPTSLLIFPLTGIKIDSERFESHVSEVTDRYIELGFEGSIIKDVMSVYTPGRNKNWVKMKRFHTEDFLITGVVEGKGKYQGMLGTLVLDANGTKVEVGSGFTDEQRQTLWNFRGEVVGRYCEVKFQEIIKKTGSLRFPTFIKMRYDL